MYIFDKEQKILKPLEHATFKSVGLRERQDLQEWIANTQGVFGEELLIIQKEFDGFQDTQERLDLLALDKQGNLVIIENKLDSSGRDVVWQALKYASYCSSLNNKNIVDIFNQYLKGNGIEKTAEDVLEEFFGDSDYENNLNNGNSQRIILVSGNFRREVTSTVLWLLNYGLRIQCFQASVYKFKDELIFNAEQIIPMKNAEDYVISMANKNLDELSTQEEMKNRHHKRYEFWTQFIREASNKTSIFANVSPSKDAWIPGSLGMSGVSINLVVTQKYARTEIFINRGSRDENKKAFDFLYNLKSVIEKDFGGPLVWERMDDKITARIKYQLDGVNAFDKEYWKKINDFLIDSVIRVERSFKRPVSELKLKLKS
ncbi:MAG: DUF4268 domain-containing protein [Patescibacteria group bacterium]